MIISFSSNPKLSRSFASILLSSGSLATKLFRCSSSVRISYSVISISEPSPSPAPFASAPPSCAPGWLALLVALITAYLFSFSISLLLSYYYTISFSRSNGTFSSISISRFFFLLNLLLLARSSPGLFLLSSNISLPNSSSMSCLLFTSTSFVMELANGFLPWLNWLSSLPSFCWFWLNSFSRSSNSLSNSLPSSLGDPCLSFANP